MNQQDIQKRAEKIVREQCFSHPAGTKIEQSTPIRGTGGLCFDSLEEVELLMALEEEFELSISDEDAEKINTFGEGVAYLAKRLAEEAATAPA